MPTSVAMRVLPLLLGAWTASARHVADPEAALAEAPAPGRAVTRARAGRVNGSPTSVRKCRVAPALGALRTDLPPLPPVVGSSWLARRGGPRGGAPPPPQGGAAHR